MMPIHYDTSGTMTQTSCSLIPPQSPSVRNATLHLSFQDITVTLKVDAGPGCGGIAWPAGQILSLYIVRQGRDHWKGKLVLELGSGTALVDPVAGYLGAPAVITDQRSASLLVPHQEPTDCANDLGRF